MGQLTTKIDAEPVYVVVPDQWKGLKTLVELTPQTTAKSTGEAVREVRYYISSLKCYAVMFNSAIRAHGGIENQLHWTPDIVFFEDQSQKRAGQAAENFSIINRVALNLLKADKSVKISRKSKRHKAAWETDHIIHLLATSRN